MCVYVCSVITLIVSFLCFDGVNPYIKSKWGLLDYIEPCVNSKQCKSDGFFANRAVFAEHRLCPRVCCKYVLCSSRTLITVSIFLSNHQILIGPWIPLLWLWWGLNSKKAQWHVKIKLFYFGQTSTRINYSNMSSMTALTRSQASSSRCNKTIGKAH